MTEILSHIDGGVMTLTFNRVDKKNSLTAAMYTALADAVEQAIQSVIISGDHQQLPQGVTQEQAGKVLSAYVQSATEMIAEAGIGLDDMVAVLDAKSLQDARMATVRGDVERMQGIARSAIDRLTSLPTRDPSAFAEYIEDRFPGLDWRMDKGHAMVHVEGRGYMPFASLVRGGFLRNAKAVPIKDGE